MAAAVPSHSVCSRHPQYGSTQVDIQPGETLRIEILTPRLKIVSVNEREHEDSLIALYGSTFSAQAVKEKIARWNQRWAQNIPFSGYVILDRNTDKFIGQVILKPLKDKEKEKDAHGNYPVVPGVGKIVYLSIEDGKGFEQEYAHAMLDHLVPALIRNGFTLAGHEVKLFKASAGTDAVVRKFMEHHCISDRYWYERRYSI